MNIFYTLITGVLTLINVSSKHLRCEEIYLRKIKTSDWLNISRSSKDLTTNNCWLINAETNEIVSIIFHSFNVGINQQRCSGDQLKVDLHGDAYNESDESSWTGSLCGHLDEIPKKFYSSGSSLKLALDLERETTPPKNRTLSFNLLYNSEKRSNNECDNRSDKSSDCDCEFSSSGSATSGEFFSPGYPSGYRANRTIRYCFTAKENERINLNLKTVRLGKSDKSCLDQRDVIRLYEGSRPEERRLVRVICNEATLLEYLSSDSVVVLELQANTEWPPLYFSANYSFSTSAMVKAASRNQNIRGSLDEDIFTTTGDIHCNNSITKEEGSGKVNVPNRLKTMCSYAFESRGPSRVKLSFKTHNFSHKSNFRRNASCDGDRGVTTLVLSEGRQDEVTKFCDKAPPIDVMSNGPKLWLTVDGFVNTTQWDLFAEYSFIKNFGVKTGKQLEGFECGFLYDAEQWPSGGYFTSPNYPGLYPRDTECHYFFQGLDWQRVKVTFNYLDVQGIPPCNMNSGSDYLEFSNCLKTDGKFQRRCGRSNFSVISEKKYLRVTFKSNGKFDATGFNATFRFFNDQAFLMMSFNKSSVSLNMIWCMSRTVLKLILLFFLLN